jgi:endonuclease YncB( thermonuclease family)
MRLKVLSFTLALALAPVLTLAGTVNGKVIRVADGDTITVLNAQHEQIRVRLAGIDAPEKSQAFGTVSKKSLSDMVYGKNVTVVYTEQDRYQRLIGKIIIDNTDINLEQLKKGYAWHYKQYQMSQSASDRETYSLAQDYASTYKLGLWADKSPSPPWNFRREKRESSNSAIF